MPGAGAPGARQAQTVHWTVCVRALSPGPVHCSGASGRPDPGLLLYLRSPGTPPPRACGDRGRSHHSGLLTSFLVRPVLAARIAEGHRPWHASTEDLGGGRLGVVGYGVTGGKGGGPDRFDSKRWRGEPARGTRRSPHTPPPRALSNKRTNEQPRTTATGRMRKSSRATTRPGTGAQGAITGGATTMKSRSFVAVREVSGSSTVRPIR